MITSFGILYNPLMALIFLAFLSGNFLWMGIVVVLYLAMYVLFKKNKQAVWSFLEGETPDNTPKEKVVA
jgi:PTS system galactitol-specific IIC component